MYLSKAWTFFKNRTFKRFYFFRNCDWCQTPTIIEGLNANFFDCLRIYMEGTYNGSSSDGKPPVWWAPWQLNKVGGSYARNRLGDDSVPQQCGACPRRKARSFGFVPPKGVGQANRNAKYALHPQQEQIERRNGRRPSMIALLRIIVLSHNRTR